MARSFFPPVHGPGGRSGDGSASGFLPASPPAGIRWLLPSLILGSGGAGLAIVFAGLWWHSESLTTRAEEARDAALSELARASGDQARQRHAMALARVSTDDQLNLTRQEAGDLRLQLETARTALSQAREDLTAAEQRRQELSAELEVRNDAGRQREVLLETERTRAGVLEQNLSRAEADLSTRAALHEQDVRDLQTHLVSLRDEVSSRDIEVTNLITRAEREIGGIRQEAQQLQQQASNLESQLSSANAENARLASEVSSLEYQLASEQAENARLESCVFKLECEVKLLQTQLAAALAAASHNSGGGGGAAPAAAAP